MSSSRALGKISVRVLLPAAGIPHPVAFPDVIITQYTKLPDHRPPLRRDKPVRISLPNAHPRLIYPAEDRSFTFIPRALRPNQQQAHQQQQHHHQQRGARGAKPSSRLGSFGGWSRRTSVYGGSFHGSAYSPSVGMSRRSSMAAHDAREMFSPTGSNAPRLSAGSAADLTKPVVRLPPGQQLPPSLASSSAVYDQAAQQNGALQSTFVASTIPQNAAPQSSASADQQAAPMATATPPVITPPQAPPAAAATSTNPTATNDAFQQAFHQQVPVSVASALDYAAEHTHSRKASYATSMHGHSTGTPLSQIPERAIHAAPFQPTGAAPPYDGQGYAQYPPPQPQHHMPQQPQQYGMPPQHHFGGMPHHQQQPQQVPYYYPQQPFQSVGSSGVASSNMAPASASMPPAVSSSAAAANAPPAVVSSSQAPSAMAPSFVPGAPAVASGSSLPLQSQHDMASAPSGMQRPSNFAQPLQHEYNGMVYYFDASAAPPMYPPAAAAINPYAAAAGPMPYGNHQGGGPMMPMYAPQPGMGIESWPAQGGYAPPPPPQGIMYYGH
jgi:hypothetical protein